MIDLLAPLSVVAPVDDVKEEETEREKQPGQFI